MTKAKELEQVRTLLRISISDQDHLLPILHNDKKIILQGYGWSVNLNDDGTWNWECTEG